MVEYQENATSRGFFPHLWFSCSGFPGGHATKQQLTLWSSVLQRSGSQLDAILFLHLPKKNRRISQSLEKKTRKESIKSNSPGLGQNSVHVLCSRLPQPHQVDAFLYSWQVCYSFRCNTKKHKCLSCRTACHIRIWGENVWIWFSGLCLSPKVHLYVCPCKHIISEMNTVA